MKQYPSISNKVIPNAYIYAFDKLDGSNIRAEWNRKRGFWKFGTRTRLVDATDSIFGESPNLIQCKFERALSDIFIKERQDNVICFFEFFGENSRFGVHAAEPHDVVLIDVNWYKKGIASPKDFIKMFGDLHIAKLLYAGYAHHDFVMQVKDGSLDGITYEGVVCKTGNVSPDMFKIKTNAWMDTLRIHCHGDEEMFKRLS